MTDPYVVLLLGAMSFALGQSGALILHVGGKASRFRIVRFAWGMLLYVTLFMVERAIWTLFAWLLGTAATDFVASYGDLFVLVCLGGVPLLLAFVCFAPHLGPAAMGILYVISFFDTAGRITGAFDLRFIPVMLWLAVSWLAALLAVWALKRIARELSARTRFDPLRDVRLLTTADVLETMPGWRRSVAPKTDTQP